MTVSTSLLTGYERLDASQISLLNSVGRPGF